MEAGSARTAKLGQAGPLRSAPALSVNARWVPQVKMLGSWQVLLAAALLALAVGTGAHETLGGGRSEVAPTVRSHHFSREGLLSLPVAAQGPVSAALGADGQAYRVSRWEGALQASSPAQHLNTRFTRSGVSVRSGTTKVGLSLLAVGYGSALAPVEPVAPSAHANRVIYRHGDLSEWYANGPLGLEQGFTIAHGPRHRANDLLTLSLVLSGNARPSLASSGRRILFRHPGTALIAYAGLHVTDARHHMLHAWLQLQSGRLLLHVDTRGARYPIRIDPFIQQGEKLPPEGISDVSVALSANGRTAIITGGTGGTCGAVDVYKRDGEDWIQEGTSLIPREENGCSEFGTSVTLSADGDTALVGGREDNRPSGAGGGFGAAWVFTWSGSSWVQQGPKLTGSEEPIPSGFGSSVALSANGSTALIGGTSYSEGDGGAWVFIRSAGTWKQQGPKIPSEMYTRDRGVALSADGNTALIGGGFYYAQVFTRSNGMWTEQGKLESNEEGFGWSVALSADGSTALIGGPYENASPPGTIQAVGSASVFTREDGIWTQQGSKLTAPNEVGYGQFGMSVALSADGNTALIGAPEDSPRGGNYTGAGAVWVFNRSGSSWTSTEEKITSPSTTYYFGGALALASESDVALISDTGGVWTYTYHAHAVPTNITPPAVSGTVEVGHTLSCSHGLWSELPASYTYTWLSNGVTVAGPGPSSEYTVMASDVGHEMLCQVVATNNVGNSLPVTSPGAGPPPVTVVTSPATEVQPTSATLHGTVIPNGHRVNECYFQYGEDPHDYSSRIQCSQTVGEASAPVAVSASLKELTPGTTYHFDLVAAESYPSFGLDETFTTTSTAPPTVTIGEPFGYWDDSTGNAGSARFEGSINPHGNDAGYVYYYGTRSVNVSSASDLSQYESTLPAQIGLVGPSTNFDTFPAGSGTTSVSTSQLAEGLQRDTKYYVRLAAFYPGGVEWSSEVSFEITAPEPQATEAPYLQVNGTDPITGYTVRRLTGTWSNTNGSFQLQWYGGTPSVSSEYNVTSKDVGRTLECKVTPYRLDGRLATNDALISDSLIPETADAVVIPTWLKKLWYADDVALAGVDGYGAILDCLEFADLPGLGEAICAGIIVQEIAGNPFEDMLKDATDPADSHYREIALPQALSGQTHARYPCARHTRPRTCRALSILARRYTATAVEIGAVLEALAISRNRTLIAREKNDTETQLIQSATRKVYGGLLATAIATEEKDGVVYADALRRAHVDEHVPASALKRVSRRPYTQIVGPRLLARMLKHGYLLSEIKRSLAESAKHVKAFDLQHFLRSPLLPIPFARYYDTVEINDLMALVRGLARQGTLRSSSVAVLFADLDRVRAACTPATRASATDKFLADAKPSLQPTFYSFLSTAAQPLTNGSSTVDPYPRCLG